jgi:ATP-dependent DNA helicase RecQ
LPPTYVIFWERQDWSVLLCTLLILYLCLFSTTESDHIDCRTDLPAGCPRCIALKPPICCKLCSPTFFQDFGCVDIEKSKSIPSCSRIKDYTASAQDLNLQDALHIFRRQAVETLFGLACLQNNGPGIFMSNKILQRIVDCAHEYKLETREDLAKETWWTGVPDHAATIILLIKLHHLKPLLAPLLISTPLRLQPNMLNQNPRMVPLNQRTVKSCKCSKCGSHGHICS